MSAENTLRAAHDAELETALAIFDQEVTEEAFGCFNLNDSGVPGQLYGRGLHRASAQGARPATAGARQIYGVAAQALERTGDTGALQIGLVLHLGDPATFESERGRALGRLSGNRKSEGA